MNPTHPKGTGGGHTLFLLILVLIIGLIGMELIEGLYRVGKAVWNLVLQSLANYFDGQ